LFFACIFDALLLYCYWLKDKPILEWYTKASTKHIKNALAWKFRFNRADR
jgi:hypothetical protein